MYSRIAQPSTKAVATAKVAVFPAPSKGIIRNQSLALPKGGGAEVLDNYFPTAEGIRLRKGSAKRGTLPAAATHAFTYSSAGVEQLFYSTATGIYEMTSPADVDTSPDALVSGLTSGDWSSVQFATSGNEFIVMVNGSDLMQQYDGDTFYSVNSDKIYLMNYDTETGAFTVGETLTGGTSGATATIVGIKDDGTTGTLYLRDIAGGPFDNDEIITDGDTGSATSDIPTGVEEWFNVTGVDTDDLSHVWKFKARLFYIERGTTDAWYGSTDAVAGALTKFPLGGVFPSGGSLISGASWSVDSGSGMEDLCAFFTDKGEVAVYSGTDPSSAQTWALVGVYRIGVLLHKNAMVRSGGDLLVATDDGIVPMSSVLTTDRSGLKKAAITYPIEELWRAVVNERKGTNFPFTMTMWHAETMLVVGVPTFSGLPAYVLVCNSRTGAWCRFTGWDVRCLTIFEDHLYFGTSGGLVVEGETGGSDQGGNYTGSCLPRFDTFNDPREKGATAMRVEARSRFEFTPQLFACADYEITLPVALNADSQEGTDVWGTAKWGEFAWGSRTGTKTFITRWDSVSGLGHALSPGLQITSGRTTAPDIEIIALHLMYEVGQVMG
jgi:hypothetical protein